MRYGQSTIWSNDDRKPTRPSLTSKQPPCARCLTALRTCATPPAPWLRHSSAASPSSTRSRPTPPRPSGSTRPRSGTGFNMNGRSWELNPETLDYAERGEPMDPAQLASGHSGGGGSSPGAGCGSRKDRHTICRGRRPRWSEPRPSAVLPPLQLLHNLPSERLTISHALPRHLALLPSPGDNLFQDETISPTSDLRPRTSALSRPDLRARGVSESTAGGPARGSAPGKGTGPWDASSTGRRRDWRR
jgi:hypothetical protein